jgi:hypothetical protein
MFPPPIDGAAGVSKSSDETFGKIEETQAALRESIEKAKALASESERLIRQHRDEMTETGPADSG